MRSGSRVWIVTRGLVGPLVLLLALAGCSNEPEVVASEPKPVDQSRQVRAAVSVKATGAAEFDWETEEILQVTRVGGPHIDANLLSVGFLLPQKTDEDPKNRFRWAFDLLNAYEDEPGTFEISSQAINPQGLRSLAFLIWMRVKDGSIEQAQDESEVEFLERFGEVRQACTVEIGEDVLSGSMACPELANDEGETVSLKVSWRDGEVVPEPVEAEASDR
jgi:hypothetical protein